MIAVLLGIGFLSALLLGVMARRVQAASRARDELQSQLTRLTQSENRYRSVLESVPCGVVVMDNGRLSFANTFMSILFGRDGRALDSLLFSELLHETSRADWDRHYALACDSGNGSATMVDLRCRPHPDRDLWVRLSLQSHESSNGRCLLGVLTDITDQRRTEEDARIIQERFKMVARGSIDGIWDWNCITGENYFSERFLELIGYEPATLDPVLATFEALLHPDDRAPTMARVHASLVEHVPYSAEYRLRTRTGDYRWFRARGQGMWDDQGRPLRLAGSIEDITEHRLRAEALEAASALESAILSSATFSVIATSLDGTILLFNAGAERMHGYQAGEMIGKATPAVLHDRDEMVARAEALSRELGRRVDPGFEVLVAGCRDGRVEEREWTYVRKDGSRFPALLSVSAIRDKQGGLSGFLGTTFDITERKQNEDQIRQLISIMDECPDFIGMADMQGQLLYHNRAARTLVGLPSDFDLSTMKIADMHPDWASALVLNVGIPAALRHESWQADTALLHRDGHEVPVSQIMMLHRDELGQPKFLSTVMRDISDRLRADEVRSRLAAMVESSNDAIIGISIEGDILSWNQGAAHLFGYTASEALGKSVALLRPAALEAETKAVIAQMSKGRSTVMDDAVGLHKDGSNIFLSLSVTPQCDLGGRVISGSWIARNATERHEQNARFEESLREKDSLLKGVYHRVKNNLQVIQSLLSLQARTLDHPPVRLAFDKAARRVRAMSLVHDKLVQSDNTTSVSLADLVPDLLRQLNELVTVNQGLIQLLSTVDPLEVGLDTAVPLALLINELVSNAIEHGFPDRRPGKVQVAVSKDSSGCLLTISDDGIGLPPRYDSDNAPTMGLRLVKTLTRQLRAQLDTPSLPRAEFRLRIPAPKGG